MKIYMPFFAALGTPDLMAPDAPVQTWKNWIHDVLIISAAVLALFCIALAIIWAARGRNSRALEVQSAAPDTAENKSEVKTWFGFKKRRRKYKRRFPTLAESGGLPPKRTGSENQAG